MVEQIRDYLQRAGGHVSADLSALEQVNRVANACRKNLGFVCVVIKDLADLHDELKTVLSYIVQPTDKRRDITCACLCCQQRLAGRKNQGAVGADAFTGKFLDGLNAVADHWYFDNDLIVDLGQLSSFAQHSFQISRNHFSAYVIVHDIAYGFIVSSHLVTTNAFLGHE